MQAKIIKKPIYKVKIGDSLNDICQKFKVSQLELLELNNIQKIEPNQVLVLPKPYNHIYVVKPLDTYEKIANSLGTTVEQIKKITNGKKMFIGQQIIF